MKKSDQVIVKILNIYFYFYFIFSILSILFYSLGLIKVFQVLTIIMLVVYIIELSLGLDRNFFGILGVVICAFLGYMYLPNFDGILLGINAGIFVVNVLKVLLILLIRFIEKKYG